MPQFATPALAHLMIAMDVAMAFALVYVARGSERAHLSPWAVGLICFALAQSLLWSPSLPAVSILALAMALESAFLAAWALALSRLNSRSLNPAWLWLPAPLVWVVCLFADVSLVAGVVLWCIMLVQALRIWQEFRTLELRGPAPGSCLVTPVLLLAAVLMLLRQLVLHPPTSDALGLPVEMQQANAQMLIHFTGSILPLLGALGFIFVIRKRQDLQFREAQDLLTTLFESTEQTVAMFDREGRCLAMNTPGAARFHLSPAEIVGKTLHELAPHVAAARLECMRRVIETGQPGLIQDQREGRLYEQMVYPVRDEPDKVVVYARDITQELAAEEMLAAEKEKFETIFDGIHEAIFIHDAASGRILDANRAACQMYGFSKESLLLLNIYLLSADNSSYNESRIHAALEECNQQGWNAFEWRARDSQGHEFWVAVNLQRLKIGNKPRVLAVVRSIEERKRFEEQLRQASNLLEASPVVAYRLSHTRDGSIRLDYVSANVSRWGYSVQALLAGQPPMTELVHPEDRERVWNELLALEQQAEVEAIAQEYRAVTATGQTLWVQDQMRLVRAQDGRILAYEGLVNEIDALKRSQLELAQSLARQQELNRKLEEYQSQLLQSEKMASIGQLAAGVAHELNNPIGFVNSNLGTLETYMQDIFAVCDAYMALEKLLPGDSNGLELARRTREEKDYRYLHDDTLALIAESRDGLARVARIVRDLKDFSRPGEGSKQWTDLHQGLDSTLNIVWNELKYKCTVVKEYGELPLVWCEPSQINQAIMNLLINAAHAIPERGTITIRSGCTDTEVFIAISDTGIGMAPEQLSRIFDPFYTTKPVGKGTGLGLSIVWSILQKHQGHIDVDSHPGVGSTFTLRLPLQPPDAPAAAAVQAPMLAVVPGISSAAEVKEGKAV